jgi:hypothetical protein
MSSISSPYNCVGSRNAPGKAYIRCPFVEPSSLPAYPPHAALLFFSRPNPPPVRPRWVRVLQTAHVKLISFSVDPVGILRLACVLHVIRYLPVTQSGKNRLHLLVDACAGRQRYRVHYIELDPAQCQVLLRSKHACRPFRCFPTAAATLQMTSVAYGRRCHNKAISTQ